MGNSDHDTTSPWRQPWRQTTQGQIDGFFRQFPSKCYLLEKASVRNGPKICPWVALQRSARSTSAAECHMRRRVLDRYRLSRKFAMGISYMCIKSRFQRVQKFLLGTSYMDIKLRFRRIQEFVLGTSGSPSGRLVPNCSGSSLQIHLHLCYSQV